MVCLGKEQRSFCRFWDCIQVLLSDSFVDYDGYSISSKGFLPRVVDIMVNWVKFSQAGFRKGRGTTGQIANICWIIEKTREFQKNIYFCFIDYAKVFDCVDHNKLWKILKEMGIQDHLTWPASWEICLQGKKQQLELDMNNRLVPNRKRSTSRLYIVTLLI